jgi:hypothetical protein
MFVRMATRTGVQLPSPPAFARNVMKSEGCRAGALAEADEMGSRIRSCELRLGKPAKKMPSFTYVYVLQSDRSIRQSGSLGASRHISPSRIPDAPLTSNVTSSPLPDAPS